MGLYWHCFDLRNRVARKRRAEKRDRNPNLGRKQEDDEDEEPWICVCEGSDKYPKSIIFLLIKNLLQFGRCGMMMVMTTKESTCGLKRMMNTKVS